MVERERDSESLGEKPEEMGAGAADPTLDIVRQLIVEAEALPAPARRPSGPATPRPGAPVTEPVAAATPVVEPAAGSDAGPEAWDDDVDDEDWDELSLSAAARPYGIIDIETGEIATSDGEGHGDEGVAEPAASRRPRKRLLRRWLVGAIRALGSLLGGAVRLLAALIGAGLAAVWRVVARFLRRPDAPRRLAVALLIIFVIAWPQEVLWLTLLVPLAAFITWASVGNDGCVELVVVWYDRLKARDADKAERIRLRAAAVSRGLNHGIERLPQRWTHGLYLPDFETDGYVPEKLKVDPFEELAARVHSAKRAGDH